MSQEEQRAPPSSRGRAGDPASVASHRAAAIEALFSDAPLTDVSSDNPYLDALLPALHTMVERLHENENGRAMPQSFIDSLDRVPKPRLKDQDCPICGVPYMEDGYPLVVMLPCPGHHKFDLECVTPWLQRNSTCPLCRHDFLKRDEPPRIATDDEEDYDDGMYA